MAGSLLYVKGMGEDYVPGHPCSSVQDKACHVHVLLLTPTLLDSSRSRKMNILLFLPLAPDEARDLAAMLLVLQDCQIGV